MDFGRDWDAKDSGLLLAALTGVHQDITSTKQALKRGGEETNPLLPRNPSGQDLDRAGLVSAAVGSGVAAMLPPEWRKRALGAWAGLEHGLAYKNRNVKLKPGTSLAESRIEGPLMMAALGAGFGHLLDKTSVQPSVETNTVKAPDGRSIPEYRVGLTKNFARGGPVGFARASSIDKRNLTYRSPKGFARLKRGV
jgi:hypothetical protein